MSEQRFKPRARDEYGAVTNVSSNESDQPRSDNSKP